MTRAGANSPRLVLLAVLLLQAHLNISVSFLMPQNYTQLLDERGVTQGQVLQYLQAALASPSDSCCAAQCCYNQLLLCDCEPSVVEVRALG